MGKSQTIIGLTGGAGVGKTTAARIFESLGATVLDADALALNLRSPGGAAHGLVVAEFGTSDREKLSRLVFEGGTEALRRLEKIIHPLLKAEVNRKILGVRGLVIYEASLLVETGRFRDLDGLIVMEAPLERRRQALQARGWSDEKISAILARQATDEERRKVATWILKNNGTEGELTAECQKILKQIIRHVAPIPLF